jgi:hypothetical protein
MSESEHLNATPPTITEDMFFDLLRRIESLEADRTKFISSLRTAVAMALKNPMAIAMMPKAMREDLKKFVAEGLPNGQA